MRSEIKQTLILSLGTGATALLSTIFNIYTGRILGPSDYSVFATAISFVYIFSIGVGPVSATVAHFTTGLRSTAEFGKIRYLLSTIYRKVFSYGLVAFLIALLAIRPASSFLQFPSSLPLFMAFGVAYLSVVLAVPRGALRGFEHFHAYNLSLVSEASIRLFVGVLLLILVPSPTSALLAYLIALAISAGLSDLRVRTYWKGTQPERVSAEGIRRFAQSMFVLAFAATAFQNLDMLLVKHLIDPQRAGYYGASLTLARASTFLFMPIGILALPHLTARHQRHEPLFQSVLLLSLVYLGLALPFLLVAWLWSDPLVQFLYGPSFRPASPLLLPLAAAFMFSNLSLLLSQAFAAARSFQFLTTFLTLLLIEALALLRWHASLSQIASVVLLSHLATFLVLLLILAREDL